MEVDQCEDQAVTALDLLHKLVEEVQAMGVPWDIASGTATLSEHEARCKALMQELGVVMKSVQAESLGPASEQPGEKEALKVRIKGLQNKAEAKDKFLERSRDEIHSLIHDLNTLFMIHGQ